MGATQNVSIPSAPSTDDWAEPRQEYGCGPVEVTGADNALYEGHVLFDNIIEPPRGRTSRAYPCSAEGASIVTRATFSARSEV